MGRTCTNTNQLIFNCNNVCVCEQTRLEWEKTVNNMHSFNKHYQTPDGLYIHTYIHTSMHACMHACIHAYIHTCMHACMHACIHTLSDSLSLLGYHLNHQVDVGPKLSTSDSEFRGEFPPKGSVGFSEQP